MLDDELVNKQSVSRIAFCSGKVYYDLLAKREKENINEVALIRLEQLYPFPSIQLAQILSLYPNAEEFLWVQEEPENMGAWSFIQRMWKNIKLKPITRKESASPATGSHKQHAKEQLELLNMVFKDIMVK